MPSGREGGTRRPVEPVEGTGASGAAPSFDGNHSGDIISWMFQNENWNDDRWPSLMDELMWFTVQGHLAWVVFTRGGFRI
jgi:hypothetical protein